MAPRFVVHPVREVPLPRLAGLGEGLLRAASEPGAPVRLAVAALAGDGVLLGRFQRAASALRLPAARAGGTVARRAGGGRAVGAGAGLAAVLLAVPPGALGAFPADRTSNRLVRGLVAGLSAAAGEPVGYFGRDFLSSRQRQVAVVSWDGSPDGAALIEALVAYGRTLALPEGAGGYPAHRDPRAGGPPWAVLPGEVAIDALAGALVAGHARAFGVEPEATAEPVPDAAPPGPPVDEAEEGLAGSGPGEVPIGFVEALVRADGGRILEVRLRGDFLAPAFAVADLERDLVGCPLAFAPVGARIDAAFHRPGAAVLGVSSLRIFADAVLAAAAA
jgi:hypothetical protein